MKKNRGSLKFAERMAKTYGYSGVALVETKDAKKKVVTLAVAKAFNLKIIKTAPTIKELKR